MVMRGGYYLKQDISHFDAQFFQISPAEAKVLRPHIRRNMYVADCARLWTPNRGFCLSARTKLWRAVSRAAS